MSSSRRLHRWSILFLAGDSLKSLLLPLAAVLFTARRSRWDFWLMWFSVPVTGFSVWRYFTTYYELADDELVIRTGLFFRNVRHIRYARVQNIERVQNPLHRMLGVAELRVETAGASEQEAKLRVLSVADAEAVRRRVIEGKRRATAATETDTTPADVDATSAAATGDASAEPAARQLLRLGFRDLVAFGLTQNRGGIVIGTIIGLAWEADLFDVDFGRPTRIFRFLAEALFVEGGLFNHPGPGVILPALAALFAIFAVIRVLSVGWAIVQLHGFTLTRHGDELRTSRGLLTRVHSTIPLARIQLVTVRQAPLTRLFRRVEVRVETAGGDKEASPGREWLAPSLPVGGVDALVAEVFPEVTFSSLEWRPAAGRAPWRARRTALRWVLLAFAAALVFPPARTPAWAAIVPAVAFAWIAAGRSTRALGHALLPEHVGAREGWWWTHASIARYAKVQAVTLGESPFDRRWEMANVAADTAGGGAHRLIMPRLAADDARAVYTRIRDRAAATTFRW